nr:hypothetical protein [Mycobacteroides abscessus]
MMLTNAVTPNPSDLGGKFGDGEAGVVLQGGEQGAVGAVEA